MSPESVQTQQNVQANFIIIKDATFVSIRSELFTSYILIIF